MVLISPQVFLSPENQEQGIKKPDPWGFGCEEKKTGEKPGEKKKPTQLKNLKKNRSVGFAHRGVQRNAKIKDHETGVTLLNDRRGTKQPERGFLGGFKLLGGFGGAP